MSLQRQRLAQSKVIDQQTRRVLHDEVLPSLHTIILTLTAPEMSEQEGVQEMIGQITEAHRSVSNLLRSIPSSQPDRLVRLGLDGAIRDELETELSGAFDAVSLEFQADALEAFQRLPPFMGEVLFYAAREALRNAAKHARLISDTQALDVYVRLRLENGLDG